LHGSPKPLWAKAIPNHGADPSGPRSGDPSSTVLPQWSPESTIDLMDSQEIATGILSLTAPGIVGFEKSERREIARRVNESTAAARLIELMGHTVRYCRFPATGPRDGIPLRLRHSGFSIVGAPPGCYAKQFRSRRTTVTCRNTSLMGSELAFHGSAALVTNSLCREQEKRTMRESEVQIGNSG